MTINQTDVILAAFGREIAKHKVVLAKKENDWKEDETFSLNTMNAIIKERLKISMWKRAAAIVRRTTPTKNIQDIGRPITRAEAIATAREISRAAEQARREAE